MSVIEYCLARLDSWSCGIQDQKMAQEKIGTFNYYNAIYRYLLARGYWWVLTEMSYHSFYADFIASKPVGGIILELELKTSWNDYRNDYLKSGNYRSHSLRKRSLKYKKVVQSPVCESKYEWLTGNYPCRWKPTHFAYAAPAELAHRIYHDKYRNRAFGVLEIRGENDVRSLSPVRRLHKLKEGEYSRFKDDAFKRAMNFMTKYFICEDEHGIR